MRPIFDSQGDIRPWGRDFWTENFLGEIIIVGGGTLLIVGIIFALIGIAINYL